MKFWMIIILAAFVLLIIFYLIERGAKNKISPKKKGSTDKSQTDNRSVYRGVKNVITIIITILIALILSFWLIKGIIVFFSERPDKVYRWEDKKEEFVWVIDETQTRKIDLIESYDTLYFPSDVRFNFIGSTVAFCVKNGDNVEVCGEKGEDLAFKLPEGSYGNRTLMFKSKNQDVSGQMTLYVWVKVYKR